jgi:chromosome segregation ATPase
VPEDPNVTTQPSDTGEPMLPKSRYDEQVSIERAKTEAAEQRAVAAETRFQELNSRMDSFSSRLPEPAKEEEEWIDPAERKAQEAIQRAEALEARVTAMSDEAERQQVGMAIAGAVSSAGFKLAEEVQRRIAVDWFSSKDSGQKFDLDKSIEEARSWEKKLLALASSAEDEQSTFNHLQHTAQTTRSALTGTGGMPTSAPAGGPGPRPTTDPRNYGSPEHQAALTEWDAKVDEFYTRQQQQEDTAW